MRLNFELAIAFFFRSRVSRDIRTILVRYECDIVMQNKGQSDKQLRIYGLRYLDASNRCRDDANGCPRFRVASPFANGRCSNEPFVASRVYRSFSGRTERFSGPM
jgi:hypothetical protein